MESILPIQLTDWLLVEVWKFADLRFAELIFGPPPFDRFIFLDAVIGYKYVEDVYCTV